MQPRSQGRGFYVCERAAQIIDREAGVGAVHIALHEAEGDLRAQRQGPGGPTSLLTLCWSGMDSNFQFRAR